MSEENPQIIKLDRSLTPKQRKFLIIFALCGNISKAAREIKVSRGMHQYWMTTCPAFKLAFKEAKEESADKLEEEAWRRAVEGWEEPIYYMGEEVGQVRRFSDALLMRLLGAHRPRKFRDKLVTHSGNIKHGHLVAHVTAKQTDNELSKLPPEILEKLIKVREEADAYLESLKQLPAPKEQHEENQNLQENTSTPRQGISPGVAGQELRSGEDAEVSQDD